MPDASRIHVLDPLVAQKIAAGEVIERPSGVLRELLDNSLDAEARSIEVHLIGGGNDELRVIDDGLGMSRSDLERCYLPHATSKIEHVTDLDQIRTLGFRGEALNAVASVSRTTITSARDNEQAHELVVEGGKLLGLQAAAGSGGTTVVVRDLFYNVPARRSFLKRGASESAVARATFLDKALPFPEVEFRLLTNGELRSFLPPNNQIGRIADAFPERTEPAKLQELVATGDGFSAHIVAGEPSAHRKDRKQLQVFVNRRRIWEYALVQAVEYAYRDYLHGGLHPTAYLLLQIEPELVDFNIHPAKREARFRVLPQIHKRVVAALSGFLAAFDHRSILVEPELELRPHPPATTPRQKDTRKIERPDASSPRQPHRPYRAPAEVAFDLATRFAADRLARPHDSTADAEQLVAAEPAAPAVRYLGQVLNLFLVVEVRETLYLIDQHAAHERVIYDRLRKGSGGQELLFPVSLEIDAESAKSLSDRRPMLRSLGIELEQSTEGWELTSIPAALSLGPEEIAVLLMDLLDRPNDFERELYASLSCRSAVMDGDAVAPERAMEIIDGVLGLENARCPHGRPVWIAFTKDHLADLVGRT